MGEVYAGGNCTRVDWVHIDRMRFLLWIALLRRKKKSPSRSKVRPPITTPTMALGGNAGDLEVVVSSFSSRESLAGGVITGRGGDGICGVRVPCAGGMAEVKGTVVKMVVDEEDCVKVVNGCPKVVNLVKTRVMVTGPVRMNPERSLVVWRRFCWRMSILVREDFRQRRAEERKEECPNGSKDSAS